MPAWRLLAQLPWATILKQTATVLQQARELRGTRPPPAAGPSASDLDLLRQRVIVIEQQQRADAELMQQLAAEIAAIAAAAQATALEVRRAYLVAIAGVAIAVIAAIVTWLG